MPEARSTRLTQPRLSHHKHTESWIMLGISRVSACNPWSRSKILRTVPQIKPCFKTTKGTIWKLRTLKQRWYDLTAGRSSSIKLAWAQALLGPPIELAKIDLTISIKRKLRMQTLSIRRTRRLSPSGMRMTLMLSSRFQYLWNNQLDLSHLQVQVSEDRGHWAQRTPQASVECRIPGEQATCLKSICRSTASRRAWRTWCHKTSNKRCRKCNLSARPCKAQSE